MCFMNKGLCAFLFFIGCFWSDAQNCLSDTESTCAASAPLCASDAFCYENTTGASSEIGPNYGCLTMQPNPAWFFLQIENSGSISITIEQSTVAGGAPNLDVDFILYGPFADTSAACSGGQLTAANTVDCSYSAAPIEVADIPNAVAGEFYLLLITNFSNQSGFISTTQTGGTGATDCSIIDVDGILGPDQNICEGSSTPLDANPNNDPDFVDYAWEFDDGSGFAPIAGTDGQSTITVSDPGQYQVTITDTNGDSDTDTVEVIVTQIPTANTVPPQLICDDDNDGFWAFDFSQLDNIVLGAQPAADFTVTYHTNIADAITGDSAITGLYTNQNAYTAEIIYARVESNANPECAANVGFQIDVFNSATANTVTPQLICDDNNDGFWDFDLDALRATVLGAQPNTDFTVSFHVTQTDAETSSTTNPLPDNFTNPTAYQAETIWVRIENNDNPDCFDTTSFNIDVFDSPTANTVPAQLICDDDNDGFWDFDLDALDAIVLNGQDPNQFNVSYHLSQNDADFNLMPLTSPYQNQVAYQEETIFVRIENVDNAACEDTSVNFIIDVFDDPTANAYTYELCDDAVDGDDTNGFVDFPLNPAINAEILGLQDPAQFTVTYHLDQTSADNNTGAITNLYTNDTQIIVRVENNDNPLCYDTAIVDLVVNALPVITNTVELIQCDDDTDGFSDFNLTEANDLISANAVNEIFTYHLSPTEATSGANAITNTLAYTNTDPSSNPDILYVRVENADGCFRVAQLELFVSATQIPNTVEILYEACDNGDVDNDLTNGIATFDFSTAEAQIRAQSGLPAGQNLVFTYYETEADALAETNAIPDIANHRNDASPFEQEIYVRVDGDIDNDCVGLGIHVRLRTINPTPNLDPQPIVLCDDVTVGDLVETFDLTQREAYIFNSDPDVVATYHLTETDANAGIGNIPDPTAYQNTDPSETIYVRVTNTNTTCYAIVELNIQVNPLPDVTTVSDFIVCENNTDFVFDFDLDSKIPEILNGQDPNIFQVTFHESQLEADDLLNPQTSPYTNTSNPQQIYVAITNTNTGCSISSPSFMIEVNEGADATDDVYEACDIVGENDGFTQFDLASRSPSILNGQDPADFSISYHFSFDDADANENPLPLLYENFTVNTQTIYARVSNNLSPDECYDIAELTLQVNRLPMIALQDEYILCLSSNNEAVVDVPPILDTGLSDADYTFEWRLNDTVLPTETASQLIPTEGGTYSVLVTDISTSAVTMCENTAIAEVIESGIPDTFTAELASEAFTGNNIIQAVATGNSTYEFSLDNGPWQLDGEFTDVSGGDHVVYVRDVNGCGILAQNVLVIDYPKYFTPNGDGNHDTWNITGIDTQPAAVIYIYDRYGKLLKQLSPTSPGWDGTFNGNRMPSSDYWFTLEYIEPTNNETRTLSSHFSLKR